MKGAITWISWNNGNNFTQNVRPLNTTFLNNPSQGPTCFTMTALQCDRINWRSNVYRLMNLTVANCLTFFHDKSENIATPKPDRCMNYVLICCHVMSTGQFILRFHRFHWKFSSEILQFRFIPAHLFRCLGIVNMSETN